MAKEEVRVQQEIQGNRERKGMEMSLPKPYYQDDAVTIYHGDCRDILPLLEPVDLVLTDPPYSEKTHKGARSLNGKVPNGTAPIDFMSWDSDSLRIVFSMMKVSKWFISFMDWRHILPLEIEPPTGLEFIRFGIWMKTNPMPQLTGDRPGTGWEAVAIFHPPGKKSWNGGGASGTWLNGTSRWGNFETSLHPTEKPINLIYTLLEQFGDKGQTILDPFAGSGTIGRAAKDLGRKAILIELEERYCEIAANRMCQEVLL